MTTSSISIYISLQKISEDKVEELIKSLKQKLYESFSDLEEYNPTFVFTCL